MIVIVTIHGIGFQNTPSSLTATDGYADALHAGLCKQDGLKDGVLGDDPNRVAAGGSGPVYVSSSFPPDTHNTEDGLKRLGVWKGNSIDAGDTKLAPDGAKYAHVALVYSHLEETQGDAIAMMGLGLLGAPSVSHYATVGGLMRMAFEDVRAMKAKPAAGDAPSPGLQVRPQPAQHRGLVSRMLHAFHQQKQPAGGGGGGPLETLRQVQDDVAAYVVRNEHRERVRAFIRDAVSRILGRPEVEGVIINSHSNGTVMGFDLIAALSPPSAARVRRLITAGCPLRKYVDCMDWGIDARNVSYMPAGRWTNFYDVDDPVADPLQPDVSWKRGQDMPAGGGPGLFVTYDPQTGAKSDVAVADVVIKNVGVSPGDLPAHNYWDNPSFWAQAAELITTS